MPTTTPSNIEPDAREPFLELDVRLANGRWFQPLAAPGFHLMELIRAFGLPIKAECGGAGVRATSHVRVAPVRQGALAPPADDALAKLDEIAGADEASPLACLIPMTRSLEGIEIELQADSIALQAAFLVG